MPSPIPALHVEQSGTKPTGELRKNSLHCHDPEMDGKRGDDLVSVQNWHSQKNQSMLHVHVNSEPIACQVPLVNPSSISLPTADQPAERGEELSQNQNGGDTPFIAARMTLHPCKNAATRTEYHIIKAAMSSCQFDCPRRKQLAHASNSSWVRTTLKMRRKR